MKKPEMTPFIGVKMIKASALMSKKEYCEYRGWKVPEGEDPDEQIYLVEYAPDPKSEPNHENHEGYISMSPKHVFDEAYRKAISLTEVDESKFQPHQQRVSDEAIDLMEKITNLKKFINGPEIFNGLSADEQNRLKSQSLAMMCYLSILDERIVNF